MILTMYTEDKHERVNTQETKRLLFKMVDIQHSNYDKNLRRALRTAITRSREDTRVTVCRRHGQVGTHTRHILLLATLDLAVTPPAIEVIR